MMKVIALILAVMSVPVFAQETNSAGAFPKLPPSDPCTANSVLGMWHLAQVYEVPAGQYSLSYGSYPYQYFLFNTDLTYREYKVTQTPAHQNEPLERMKAMPAEPLLQYVLGEKGALYFYRAGVAENTQMCFVVGVDQAPFKSGQILLMPPADPANPGRVLRVYDVSQVAEPAKAQPTANAPAATAPNVASQPVIGPSSNPINRSPTTPPPQSVGMGGGARVR